jgi:hypothetical protein
MIEAWSELPAWLRLLIALIIMGIGGVVLWYASVKVGFGLIGLGFIMFMIGGKTRGEKSEYRF